MAFLRRIATADWIEHLGLTILGQIAYFLKGVYIFAYFYAECVLPISKKELKQWLKE
jgi:hypothetical protein